MSHARKKIAFPEAFKPKKLSEIKDKDEKRFLIEDAARTIESAARIDREIQEMKKDSELFTAAQALVDQKIADLKKAKTT